jgi:twitching motility protein PilT
MESFDQGMQSFDQALIQLLTQDLITEEEALKNSSNPKDFELRLKGVISKEWGEKTDIKEISNIDNLPKSIEIEEIDEPPRHKKRSR